MKKYKGGASYYDGQLSIVIMENDNGFLNVVHTLSRRCFSYQDFMDQIDHTSKEYLGTPILIEEGVKNEFLRAAHTPLLP